MHHYVVLCQPRRNDCSGTKRKQMAKPRDTLGSHYDSPVWEMSNGLYAGETIYNPLSEQQCPGITSSVTLLSGGAAWSSPSLDVSAAGDWGGWDVPNDRVGLPLTHNNMCYGEVSDSISSPHASPKVTNNMRYRGPSHFYPSKLSEVSVSPLCPESIPYDPDFYDPGYSTHSELIPHYTGENSHLYNTDKTQDDYGQSKAIKWHEMPKQADPKLEEKRQRAIKSRKDRDRQKKLRKNLEEQLDSLNQEVSELKLQKKSTQDNIKFMEEKIERVWHGGEYTCTGVG